MGQAILVTGAARSGKSEFAEQLLKQSERRPISPISVPSSCSTTSSTASGTDSGKASSITAPSSNPVSNLIPSPVPSTPTIVYLATANRDDDDREWQARIEQHRDRRPAHWQTIETSRLTVNLPTCIADLPDGAVVLLDSFGTWVASQLEQEAIVWQALCEQTIAAILYHCQTKHGTVICVSEETGWGVVPAYPLGRLFRDRLGTLTRQAASQFDQVYLVVAGLAIDLRQIGQKIEP